MGCCCCQFDDPRLCAHARYPELSRAQADAEPCECACHTYDEDDDLDDEERDCLICGGEGWVFGETFGDPLWYDADEVYPCKSCGGSGLRKDMMFW